MKTQVEVTNRVNIFDIVEKEAKPVQGILSKTKKYKNWKLCKKSRDSWDIGLKTVEDIKKIKY